MSRAFVKEDGNDLAPLPDLPISTHPNHVTPRGHLALATLRARTDRLDRLPEAAAERDIRYLEARLRSAILCDPASLALTEVAFGLCVAVAGDNGQVTRYEIVGEDEADARLGRIAPQSPLARALIGARVGDKVSLRRPAGTLALTVQEIAHAVDPAFASDR